VWYYSSSNIIGILLVDPLLVHAGSIHSLFIIQTFDRTTRTSVAVCEFFVCTSCKLAACSISYNGGTIILVYHHWLIRFCSIMDILLISVNQAIWNSNNNNNNNHKNCACILYYTNFTAWMWNVILKLRRAHTSLLYTLHSTPPTPTPTHTHTHTHY
jgi:hypothetical protein